MSFCSPKKTFIRIEAVIKFWTELNNMKTFLRKNEDSLVFHSLMGAFISNETLIIMIAKAHSLSGIERWPTTKTIPTVAEKIDYSRNEKRSV